MDPREALGTWMLGEELTDSQCETLLDQMVGGQVSDIRLAALLTALQMKGATGSELAGFARALRHASLEVSTSSAHLVDTCGTGGGPASFNISTSAAFVASAAGVKVAKHGNRAVTSACGSADVLEALGVRFDLDREVLAHILETVGIAFLFAPHLHPVMAAVAPVRRELGIRTVFNQLGPLANPAGASRQVIGVYAAHLIDPMIEATRQLGLERALVVHGLDGLDEVSPCGPTHAACLDDSQISRITIDEDRLGCEYIEPSALTQGETVGENADILKEAVTDIKSLRCAAILPSAGAAIWVAGLSADLRSGIELARNAVASGRARQKLDALVEATNAP